MKKMILALALVGASISHAGTKEIKQAQEACLENAMSNIAMKQCEGEAYDAADKLLNEEYKKIKSSLSDSEESSKEILRRLVTAERAWITYRDAECELQASDMLGGTGEGLIRLSCLAGKTLERVDALTELFPSER